MSNSGTPYGLLDMLQGKPPPGPAPPPPSFSFSPFPVGQGVTNGMMAALQIPASNQNGPLVPVTPRALYGGGYPSPTGTVGPAVSRPAETINRSQVAAPTDTSLGFNPDGPGQWDAALRHPFDAIRALNLEEQAERKTTELYPEVREPHNDEADAFRHAYWSYLTAKAVGANDAQLFGNAHEISVPNPAGERSMDLYNNQVGRNLASQNGDDKDAAAIVRDAIRKGLLRTSPY